MKILAVIESSMYLRNYLLSGAFDELLSLDDFHLALGTRAWKLAPQAAARLGRPPLAYEWQPENAALVHRWNKVSALAFQERSSTFRIKSTARWFGDYEDQDYEWAKDMGKFQALCRRSLLPNRSLAALIDEVKPQVILFPFTGVEPTGYELLSLSAGCGFKTVFLCNAWDNLSSKGLFLYPPDLLGVIGPQQLVDAVTVQGYPHQRCALVGCARYESYFTHNKAFVSPFPTPYVLFCGSTKPCDELTPLHALDEALRQSDDPHTRIVYRPHPWRERRNCNDDFRPEDFYRVLLDPQIANAYYQHKKDGSESVSAEDYPPLDYLPDLLHHALFIVSPMTSMILEGALYGTPSLCVAYDDGCHKIHPGLMAQEHHFRGAQEVEGWFFARSEGEMVEIFLRLLKDGRKYLTLEEWARCFLFWDGRSYGERVLDAVERWSL